MTTNHFQIYILMSIIIEINYLGKYILSQIWETNFEEKFEIYVLMNIKYLYLTKIKTNNLWLLNAR